MHKRLCDVDRSTRKVATRHRPLFSYVVWDYCECSILRSFSAGVRFGALTLLLHCALPRLVSTGGFIVVVFWGVRSLKCSSSRDLGIFAIYPTREWGLVPPRLMLHQGDWDPVWLEFE